MGKGTAAGVKNALIFIYVITLTYAWHFFFFLLLLLLLLFGIFFGLLKFADRMMRLYCTAIYGIIHQKFYSSDLTM